MEANRWRQLIRWYELGESRQIIQAILEQPPLQRDYDTVSLLARALCAERRYEEAAEQLTQVAEEGQDDPMWYFRLAYASLCMGQTQQAAGLLEQMLELAPDSREGREMLEICRRQLARQNRQKKLSAVTGDPVEDLRALLPEGEGIPQGDKLEIPAWQMTIRPRVHVTEEGSTIVSYQVESPQWDRPVFEASVGMGTDPERSLAIAITSFRYGMLDGLRAMAEQEPFAWVTSEYAGEEHSWQVYRSSLVGLGDTPYPPDYDAFWDRLGQELLARLGNQSLVYVKVFAARMGDDITAECRVNDVLSPSLSRRVEEYVHTWQTEEYGSQKQFFFFRQQPVTQKPYPHSWQDLRRLTNEAVDLFGQCVERNDYEDYLQQLCQLTGDPHLAEELYSFLPEICAEVAYAGIISPETVVIRRGKEETVCYKSQMASYYIIYQALLERMEKDAKARGLFGYFVAASSIYKMVRQAKEQGRSLEEEGAEITVRFGFSENYQLR